MHILIDAYNLIKKIYPKAFSSREQIQRCVNLLAEYASIKHHVLVIIFDGGDGLWPTEQDYSHLCKLWWVGAGLKADDFIKELLEQKHKFHLLVSCDRELVLHAQDNKIPSIEVTFFWEFVKKAVEVSKQKSPQKQRNNQQITFQDKVTIEDLMEEFPCEAVSKDLLVQESEIFVSKKHLSKLEIQLYTIIKKL